MAYRVEISSTSRAVCNGTNCKKEQTKILKGELRYGTMVTIQEHTTWKWRHFGCVTPLQVKNWAESSGMDMELVDGYEDLPSEAQAKVKRALEQGHVDDEDWNGDAEMNRYNPDKPNQGMYVKASAKKKKAGSEDEAKKEEASPSKKAAPKKRGRANVDKEDAEEDMTEPAPKKSKTRKAIKPEAAASTSRSKKGKKSAKNGVIDEPSEQTAAPTSKKGRSKKVQATENVNSDMNDALVTDETPVPVKKGRGKKNALKATKSGHVEEDIAAPKPQERQRKGKKAAAGANDQT